MSPGSNRSLTALVTPCRTTRVLSDRDLTFFTRYRTSRLQARRQNWLASLKPVRRLGRQPVLPQGLTSLRALIKPHSEAGAERSQDGVRHFVLHQGDFAAIHRLQFISRRSTGESYDSGGKEDCPRSLVWQSLRAVVDHRLACVRGNTRGTQAA